MTHLAVQLLQKLPAETAHNLALKAIAMGLAPGQQVEATDMLRTTLWGMEFAHPLGLAAGFDKNAVAVDGLLGMGFSYVEVGTVTPKPQKGNAQPRLFRLREDMALINRMGFNNDGADAVVSNLKKSKRDYGHVGINIGCNKETQDRLADYTLLMEQVWPYADYLTVNISSPNTPGLRDLQKGGALEELLGALAQKREALTEAEKRKKPMLLKIAPDMHLEHEQHIVDTVQRHGFDGLVLSNTTIARPDTLRSARSGEVGGLSGKPLREASTAQTKRIYKMTDGKLPLIGVGGIMSGADAYARIGAGASLLQLYTGFVYHGPTLIPHVLNELQLLLERDGFKNIQDAVGHAVK